VVAAPPPLALRGVPSERDVRAAMNQALAAAAAAEPGPQILPLCAQLEGGGIKGDEVNPEPLGVAIAGHAPGSSRPVFCSVGHRVTLDAAARLTLLVSRHRVPEPIRQADLIGREYVRQRYGEAAAAAGEDRGGNGDREGNVKKPAFC
jgi:hypothetical protein